MTEDHHCSTTISEDVVMASERKAAAVKKELYKTELCRHYAVGRRCPYRNKCQFAHGSDEIVDIARHPKYKTEPCKSYHSKGFCTYGPRCHFVHDYTDDSTRNSLTGGEVTRTGPGGVQDATQSDERQEEDQRKSNGRSNAAATKVTSLVSSSSPGDDGELEVYRGGASHEWSRGFQGSRRTWRQKKQDSSEEDSKEEEERSSEAQRLNADNYLVQKSSGQSEDNEFSVDDRWVKDENEELMTKISQLFPLFSVKESADDKFESSSFYRNSFFHFDFSGTRQKNENPSAARPADGSTNLQTKSKYSNSMMSSDERFGESPDLFNFQTSHQYVPPYFGGKLWTQRHKQPENARPISDLNDSVDQNAKDSSLPPLTANVFRRCLCSSQSSSVSRELVYDNGKINGEDFSTDLRRILEEQMFALQSSLLMDTLNQNLQQSTCG